MLIKLLIKFFFFKGYTAYALVGHPNMFLTRSKRYLVLAKETNSTVFKIAASWKTSMIFVLK